MKSYIKFLSRNKLYAFIEAFGLAVSLAFVILIGTYVWQQYSIAYENPDHDRIYVAGDVDNYAVGYYDKEDLETSIPEIEIAARYSYGDTESYSIGGQNYYVSYAYTDKELFDMFHYDVLEGSADLLDNNLNVLVSRKLANIISEDGSDVIGKQVYSHYEPETVYTIAGIVENFENTIIPYSDLIFSAWDEDKERLADNSARYGSTGYCITFFRVAEGTDRDELFGKIEPMFAKNYGGKLKIVLNDLDEIYFHEDAYMTNSASTDTLRILLIVVFALLVSALINYVNLTFALTGRRAKEMATRRLVGAQKADIFLKNILESVAFTLVCFAVAMLLAINLVPMANSLMTTPEDEFWLLDTYMRVPLSIDITPGYIMFLIVVAVLLGSFVGIMPALNASGFQPIEIIKGSFRRREKMVFSKVFIVVQNVLSIVLIAMAVLMEVQLSHMIRRPMNADMDNLYYMRIWELDGSSGQVLVDRLARLPEVKDVGIGSGYPGGMGLGFGFIVGPEKRSESAQIIICDTTYFRLLNPRIISDFNRSLKESVWLSESAAAALNYSDSLDAKIANAFNGMNGSHVTHVGGIYEDIPVDATGAYDNPNSGFVLQPYEILYLNFGLLISTYDESPETRAKILAEYETFAKEYGVYDPPFVSTFLSDATKSSLAPAIRTVRIVELFMILSVILSLLGLLAMSTYYSEQKSKEIAVRKVFGGTVESETVANVRSYMIMVLVACVIGVPIAVYLSGIYLEQFAYRISNYWWVFALAVLLSFAISLASVLWQTLKAARTNPATELKKE